MPCPVPNEDYDGKDNHDNKRYLEDVGGYLVLNQPCTLGDDGDLERGKGRRCYNV
jgi:hypothetical protein